MKRVAAKIVAGFTLAGAMLLGTAAPALVPRGRLEGYGGRDDRAA